MQIKTRIKLWLRTVVICTSLITCCHVLAQTAGPPAGLEKESIYTQGTISQEQMKQLAEFLDQKQLRDGKDLVNSRIAAERSAKALKALNMDCKVTSAMQISRPAGKDAENSGSGLYEASCENGTGFVIMIRPDKQVGALSCFAIDAALSTNSASPDTGIPNVQCKLPENADASSRASHTLSRLGVTCNVVKTTWLGLDTKSNLEYYEAACENNERYVVHAPVPGYPGNIGAVDCAASAVPCIEKRDAAQQQPTADARPDLAWFKTQLSAAHVTCDVLQGRIIGREKIRRRYVVEFQCRDNPKGLVAFVPPDAGDTKDFESMDCAAAMSKHVTCEFSREHSSATKPHN